MNPTRRSLLKAAALAAVPLTGAATALSLPGTASAATISASQFTLAQRTGNSYGSFANLNSALSAALPNVSISDVLADGNRPATHVSSLSGVSAYVDGFTWNPGDNDVDYWVPQGITTSEDALGAGVYPAGGDRAIAVSWYFDTDPNGDGVADYSIDKGIRVSFVNYNSASAPVYRHVLLVEPCTTSSGAASFKPVKIHAGGIMWYGNLLYVVDTYKGLRVFDLDTVWRTATDNGDACGLQSDGSYQAYGYTYAIPQSLAYDNSGTLLRYSALALDRASSPDSLTVVEYTTDASAVDYSGSSWNGNGTTVATPKIVRWNLDYTTRLLSSGTASEAITVSQAHMQGAVAQQGTHYLSCSDGSSADGSLRTTGASGGSTSALTGLYIGCEDLSFHSSAATDWAYGSSVIWTLCEYAGIRHVYAVRASG